jgi:hypothetical protein
MTNASLLTSGTLDAARLPGSVVLTTDARLSDARQPLTHTHTASQISDFTSSAAAAAPTYAIQSDTVSNVSYIGRAVSGTATSEAAWRIRRITVAAAGTATVATATNVAWNNRLAAS